MTDKCKHCGCPVQSPFPMHYDGCKELLPSFKPSDEIQDGELEFEEDVFNWRYEFAGRVMQARLSMKSGLPDVEDLPLIAKYCVMVADALLEELEKE